MLTSRASAPRYNSRVPTFRVMAAVDIAAPAPLADEGSVTNPILQVSEILGQAHLLQQKLKSDSSICF